MEYRKFGRSSARASIVGLGAGGASRLGLAVGGSEAEAVRVVQQALDLGVNYLDTAENYGTEEVVGRGIAGRRDGLLVSSKIAPRGRDGELITRGQLRESLSASLKRLRLDVLDVYHLHRPEPEEYEYCVSELVPELLAMRDEGKVRLIGVSESSRDEGEHSMLLRAIQDEYWDVMMTGFNLLNQSDRYALFPETIEKGVAIEIMGGGRNPFNREEDLVKDIRELLSTGQVGAEQINVEDPLDFVRAAGISSLAEASYRFVAYEPGVNVVLVGTGNVRHLEDNIRSIGYGPLPSEVRERFVSMFGHLRLVLKRYGHP